ncbi:Bud-site selection protein [Phyllosticta citrichinensis]
MPKRKRSGASPAPADDINPALARQRAKLLPLLDRSKKTLIKTLKLARGFERQKLSRRLKTAQTANDAATAARVAREIDAVKALQFERLAEVGLGRLLGKVKRVREHEALPPWVLRAGLKGASAEERKEVLDLQARLFNARATRVAMDAIVEDVRACLGVEAEEKGKKKVGVKENKAKPEEKNSAKTTRKQVEEEDADSESEEAEGHDGQGDDVDSEDEFAGFSDRIAASSDEEEEVDDVLRVPPGYKPTRDLSVTPDPSPAASEEDEEDEALASIHESDDDNDEQQPSEVSLQEEESDAAIASPSLSPSPEPPSRATRAAAPTKSTFIPSLSAVGYISGSDSGSEPEDIDEAVAPPRKNRRGQRARQAIWEKKYGEKAAHMQKQQQKAKTDRNAGWDAKRGATTADGGRNKGVAARKGAARFDGGQGRSGPDKDSSTAANTTALGKRKVAHRDDEGKLHPSWEAKKRLKEQASAKVEFQGKKITFD